MFSASLLRFLIDGFINGTFCIFFSYFLAHCSSTVSFFTFASICFFFYFPSFHVYFFFFFLSFELSLLFSYFRLSIQSVCPLGRPFSFSFPFSPASFPSSFSFSSSILVLPPPFPPLFLPHLLENIGQAMVFVVPDEEETDDFFHSSSLSNLFSLFLGRLFRPTSSSTISSPLPPPPSAPGLRFLHSIQPLPPSLFSSVTHFHCFRP